MKDQHAKCGLITRRELMRLGAAGVVFAPSFVGTARAAMPSHHRSAAPRNIIFLIADGMSLGVPAMAELFSQVIRGRGTNWHALARDARTALGWFDMASLDSPVTDSAAAASAWGSGSRIFNWAMNMLPDGRALTPIAPLAKRAGRAVGLVTTTRITHATPAGFAAAAPSRNLEDDIAPQYLDVVDVLLGGGRRHFDSAQRRDKRDLLREFREHEYACIESRDQLRLQAASRKVLGLFDAGHLPYVIDRNRDASLQRRVPTLAEMTQAALNALADSPEGFLLQVEGGRVDQAAHNNDAATMLWEQLAFDDAVGVVREFCESYPDTLVIIATDHGCGNPGLNGMGRNYSKSDEHFQRLATSQASFEAIHARLTAHAREHGAPPDATVVAETIAWGTGIDIDERDAETIAKVFAGESAPPELNNLEANISGVVAQILGNHTGIGWTGVAHTSDWTPILAFGPGGEKFQGLLKNTDAFEHMAACMGIVHRNPKMNAEEAKKFAALLPRNEGHAFSRHAGAGAIARAWS